MSRLFYRAIACLAFAQNGADCFGIATTLGSSTDDLCKLVDAAGHLTIPENMTHIPDYALLTCMDSVISLTIPDSVVSVGELAIPGGPNFKCVTIGKGVTEIKQNFNQFGHDGVPCISLPNPRSSYHLPGGITPPFICPQKPSPAQTCMKTSDCWADGKHTPFNSTCVFDPTTCDAENNVAGYCIYTTLSS